MFEWPQRVIAALGRDPQPGDWYAECCILDFQELDAEHIAFLEDLYDDFDTGGRFYRSKEEGLAELLPEAERVGITDHDFIHMRIGF